MNFKHEIIGFKDRGDKNYVDENVSEHGTYAPTAYCVIHKNSERKRKQIETPKQL